MDMTVAVKVVSGMTLTTVASCCCRGVRRAVMTGSTCIMLLGVRCIYKVNVIYCLGMTCITFRLERYLGRMILGRMSRKVARYSTVTLATIAS